MEDKRENIGTSEENEGLTPQQETSAQDEVEANANESTASTEESVTEETETSPEVTAEAATEAEQQPEAEVAAADQQEQSEEVASNQEETVEATTSEATEATTEPEATTQAEKEEKTAATDNKEADEDGEEEEDDHEDEHIDYSNHTKEQLLEDVAVLSRHDDVRKADRELREIAHFFEEITHKEEEEALKKFIENGGEKEDFEYRDEAVVKFEEYAKIIRERKSKFFHELEKQKDHNLHRKNEILEKLREIVDGEESTTSINALKEIQNEWKSIGPVPGQHNRTLWANYNALIDRFYDQRSIYFELKELDRKKNLDAKLALCEKAEELAKLTDISEATKQLNELHEEFKHIGPIPKEDQEPVWQRFKAASDSIYAKRREFVESLKGQLKENLEKKQALVEEVKQFEAFNSDRINDWNAKTKEILEIQKRWEAIGGIPRDKAKAVNKSFWGPFKHFFHNKGAFFKTLEGKRAENLEQKRQLVEQAEALKDSEDWGPTAEKLKKLQQDWRNIGPVPEKFRNEVFEQFKKACDHFFDRKRGHDQVAEKEYYDNLDKKNAICDQLDEIAKSKNVDPDAVYDLIDDFVEIGFVPRKDIKKIKSRFEQAVKNVIANADNLDEEEKEDLRINLQVNKLKIGPNANRKLHRKENSIKRKISNLENDISTWNNNLQFFANSKNADKLKADFEEKVEKANEELEHLKRELQALHQA